MIKKILLVSAMVFMFGSVIFAQGYRYDERRGYGRDNGGNGQYYRRGGHGGCGGGYYGNYR